MQRGAIFSAALHVALALLIIFGLPLFNAPKEIVDQPVVLEMVTVAEKTNPRPNPTPVEAPRPTPEPPKPVEAKPAPAPPPPTPAPPPPQVAERAPAPTPSPKPPEPKPEVKPEPVPAPKPEVKKPEPPKEPPKPQVAAKPPPKRPDPPKKEPPKKQEEDFIASILKNVAPAKPQPTQPTQQPARPQQTAPQPAAPPSLDQQVTRSEIDAVRDQIAQCWVPPAGARDASDLVVTIRADVGPDGNVIRASIVNTGRMSDPFYRAAAESAYRAVLNPRCQPLKLPAGKYNQWKSLELNFNPKDMIG